VASSTLARSITVLFAAVTAGGRQKGQLLGLEEGTETNFKTRPKKGCGHAVWGAAILKHGG